MNLSRIKASLSRKVGPLPLGAWLAILVLGILIARYIRGRNAANSQDSNANQDMYGDPTLGGSGIGFDDGSGGGFFIDPGTGGDSGATPPGGTGGSDPTTTGGSTPDPTPGDAQPNPTPSTDPDPSNPGGPNQPITDPFVTHDAPTHITTANGTKIFDDGATSISVSRGSTIVKKITDDTAKVLVTPRDSHPVASPTRVTAPSHPAAPELISEHGAGQVIARPSAPKVSPAVAPRPAPVLVSEHGQGGGYSPPPSPGPALMSVAAPSGHSVAIAPSAAPSTVGVPQTAKQFQAMGRKNDPAVQ